MDIFWVHNRRIDGGLDTNIVRASINIVRASIKNRISQGQKGVKFRKLPVTPVVALRQRTETETL
jgi:hypothetical protein